MALTRPARSAKRYRYHAFVSYGHEADKNFAPILQRVVEQLAKPWYRRRALVMFRDETDLAVNPDLWVRVADALDESEHLLLLASESAAQSPWVARELRHWSSRHDTSKLLIALTGGNISWNETCRDFDWEHTDAVPKILAGSFASEPLWVDFRSVKNSRDGADVREPAIRLAAGLRGVAPRDIDNEDLRQHRRTVRLAGATIAVLAILLIAAIASSIYAFRQRDLAVARQLAATADLVASESEGTTEISTLLALESLRYRPLLENRRLLGSNLPLLLHPLIAMPINSSRTAAICSADGRYIVVGGKDHVVRRYAVVNQKEEQTFTAHSEISTIASSPGGNVVAVGDDKGMTYFLHDSLDEISRFSLGDAEDGVKAISFSADGEEAVAVTFNGRVAVIRVEEGQAHSVPVRIRVNAAALSPDGKLLVVGGYKLGQVLDISTGRLIFTWPLHHDVNVISYAANGQYIGFGTGDSLNGEAALFDIRKNKALWNLPTNGGVTAFSFSPDLSQIAIGGWDQMLRVLKTLTAELISSLQLHDAVLGVSFSTKGNYVASAGRDGTTRILDLKRLIQLSRLEHGGEKVQFTREGDLLFTVGLDSTVTLFSVADPGIPITIPAVTYQIALDTTGQYIALATEHGLHVAEAFSGKEISATSVELKVDAIDITPGGKFIAAASGVDTWVLSLKDGRELGHLKFGKPVNALAITNGAERVVIGSDEGARVFDVATGTEIYQVPGLVTVKEVSVSGDGRLLAAVGEEDGLEVVDLTARRIAMKESTITSVASMTFDPRGRYLLTGGWDHIARLFDIRAKKQLFSLMHTKPVRSVAFSSDGKLLTTAATEDILTGPEDEEDVARLFSTESGDEVAHVVVRGKIFAAIYDPGKSTIVTLSGRFGTGILTLEHHVLDQKDLMELGCSLVTRNLSCAEWKQYESGRSYKGTCTTLPAPHCN
jgi:WD40 repeat protein